MKYKENTYSFENIFGDTIVYDRSLRRILGSYTVVNNEGKYNFIPEIELDMIVCEGDYFFTIKVPV